MLLCPGPQHQQAPHANSKLVLTTSQVCWRQTHTSPTAPRIHYPLHLQLRRRKPDLLSHPSLTNPWGITKTSSNLTFPSLSQYPSLPMHTQAEQAWKTGNILSKNSERKQKPVRKTHTQQRKIQESVPRPIIIPNTDTYQSKTRLNNSQVSMCHKSWAILPQQALNILT